MTADARGEVDDDDDDNDKRDVCVNGATRKTCVGHDSSVDIATPYGQDGPWNESR